MDSVLEKIYSISPEEAKQDSDLVMLGSGAHGLCFREGKGVRLTDIEGKRYIDCTSQGWALFLGHANEEIRQAVYEQMGMLTHLNQNSDSLPRYALAKELTQLAPGQMNRVLFTVGGSAAIEAAMKLAVKNAPGARKFITLMDGYHGTSLTTGAASWISTKAAGVFTGFHDFAGITNDLFVRVPNPYLYRWSGSADPEDCIDFCLGSLKAALWGGAGGQVAGVILEPLQANGGQIPLPPRYLQGVRKLCDAYGCLLIFDELQTYCRVGDWFAAEKFGVEPDIICMGKSLGAGFPIAAVLLRDGLKGFGPLGEDIHTFSNNSVAQVAALKQIEIIRRDGLLEHTNRVGAYAARLLGEMQKKYPRIGDVRQVGLHVGIEFVRDPATREPDVQLAETVRQLALQGGAIFGQAGYRMNILKFKPPLIISEAETAEAMAILEDAVGRALAAERSRA